MCDNVRVGNRIYTDVVICILFVVCKYLHSDDNNNTSMMYAVCVFVCAWSWTDEYIIISLQAVFRGIFLTLYLSKSPG